MANGENSLNEMLVAFETAHAVEGAALRAMLDNTPALKTRVNEAIANGQLSGFGPHDEPGMGSYSPQTGVIRLPMDHLADAAMHRPGDARGNTTRIVLGHEIGHALNKANIEQTNQQFAEKIATIATSTSPHDYTDALRERGSVQRVREAKDEIAGINSMVDFVRQQKPDATLTDIYKASPEMRSYIDKTGIFNPVYTVKDGLTFGPDLKIAETPANVEAMGQLFYDTRGYPQNYGAVGLALIAKAEATAQAANPTRPVPTIQADLASLGIDKRQVPAESLPAGFTDTSATQRLTHASPTTRTPADEALTHKIHNSVVELETGLGKRWDDSSERLTASLTLLAKQRGFSERDDLAVMFNQQTPTLRAGEVVFLHRTGATASADPAANRAHMTTSEALAEPAQARYQQALDTPANLQSLPQQSQANPEVAQAESQSQSPPAMQKMQR